MDTIADPRLPQSSHITHHASLIRPDSEDSLLSELNAIDLTILEQQRALILHEPPAPTSFSPFTQFSNSGNSEDKARGQQLVAEGKVGCLLLAGGQGSRLRFSGPKGCFPISVIKNKTLFQLCAEKVVAAGKLAGRPLFLAIMTSNQNDADVREFFRKNNYFGLSLEQISFFPQSDLPLLTAEGKLFLETPHHLAQGPDGNGRCLEHLVKSGIWSKWYNAGVRYLNLVLIDNPLADPFDAEFIGFMEREGVDAALKCTEKKIATERVGLLVMSEGSCRVIEYSEMPEETKKEVDENGNLRHRCANLSLFGFTMDFVQRVGGSNEPMPLHKAWKAVPYLDENGLTQTPEKPNAWKFEAFIFDVLPKTPKVSALLYPRAQTFAPLKNETGADSPPTVREALQKYDASVLRNITGIEPPLFAFELAPEFHYPTPELLKKWKGRTIEKEGYIVP